MVKKKFKKKQVNIKRRKRMSEKESLSWSRNKEPKAFKFYESRTLLDRDLFRI